ncbi:MAG: hypothetical protein QNJ45_23920 [Ardenticatenaceae bacterium]|nr:hypothetical protein [Ardenticatenaceae bacterium]
MATLIIRHLSEDTENKLRRMAERHGWSMAEEARCLLDLAVCQESRKGLGTWIRQQVADIDKMNLDMPAPSTSRRILETSQRETACAILGSGKNCG